MKRLLDHYDFSGGVKNPYAAHLRSQVTVQLDAETIAWFKAQEAETGIPYQKIINFYLSDCAKNKKRITWA